MDALSDAIRDDWDALVRLSPRLTVAVLILLLSYVVGRVVGFMLERVLRRRRSSLAHIGFFRRLAVAFVVAIGLTMSLTVVGLEGIAAGLLTSGGLVAVVVAFAFRGIGENLLAGLFLAFSCPFDVGNVIASGEFEGEVRSVELRYTHIRTADGRDVYVPNAHIFNEPLVNYTRDGLQRLECAIAIDYADDLSAALQTMAAQAALVAGVLPNPAPFARVRELSTNNVVLSVLYWVDVFKAERSIVRIKSECNERVCSAIMAAGFTVSSNVSTTVDLRTHVPLDVSVASDDPAAT